MPAKVLTYHPVIRAAQQSNSNKKLETAKSKVSKMSAPSQKTTPKTKPLTKSAASKKKDTWKADLYEYLMVLFSTALKALEFIRPNLGTAVSKAVAAFSKLNPFK